VKIGITCYPVVGGSGIVATELGMHLARRGHQVHFISYQMPFRLDRFHENVFFHEVEVSSYPLFKYPPYTLSLAAKMRDVVCRYQLDLLHVHYAIPHATAAFLAKQFISDCRIKVITTLHGTDVTLVGSDPSFFEITKFSVAASDGVTAVSEFLKQETYDVFGIDKPIEVIHNFIDTEVYKPETELCPRHIFTTEGHKIVMHLSNFRPVKRIADVIETFRIIHEKVKSKLILIGEGPEMPLAQSLIDKHHLREDVVCLGNQDSVESILPAGDLFLLPSSRESFGLAALEAMACGMPVISTLAGGVPELIRNGEDGYLFGIGDVKSMGRAGVDLLSSEEKLKSMKAAARATAVERFSAEQGIKRYEDFYLKIRAENNTVAI
jgi:N-acetyl-alpha-D-glucosaminyl L-malate synthase BshA